MARRDLRVVIDADAAKLQREVMRAQRSLAQLEQEVNKGNAAADKWDKQMSRTGSTIVGKVGPALAGLVSGMQVFDKVFRAGFERLTTLENAEKRFRQMGLSVEEVDGLMAGLNDTLVGTPFALDAGADALARLVAAGTPIEDVNRNFELLADAAAFAQVPIQELTHIWERVQAEGRLTGETLRMLQERGVPALQLLADAAGVTESRLRDMISGGEINAQRFFDLWATGAQGFGENNIKMAGAAKSMGDTMSGALANAETAAARLGAELLERFVPTINALAEGTTNLADSLARASDGLDGFNAKAESTIEKIVGQDLDKGFFDEVGWNTVTLGLYGFVTGLRDLVFGTEEASDAAKLAGRATKDLGDDAADAAGGVRELVDVIAAAQAETAAATEAFKAYQDALKASTDPVFALTSALQKVDEAEAAVAEARKEHGAASQEAVDAELKLFQALTDVDAAANNSELSFQGVNDVLAGYVEQGLLTEEAAARIRDRINDAREAAEDYQGEYVADMLAETDQPAIRRAEEQLNTVARVRNPDYRAQVARQDEIRARNRLDALGRPRNAPISAQAGNIRQVEGALDRLARSRFMTIHVGYAVTGSGLPAGLARGHSGGVPRFHTGGVPRFHDGGGLGLANDEGLAILQTRERVLSREQNRAFEQFVRSFTNAVPVPQSMSAPSAASDTPGYFTGELRLDSGEFLGKVRGVLHRETREVARVSDLIGRGG